MHNPDEAREAARPMMMTVGGDDEELQRAELYGLLSRLWMAPPDEELLSQFRVAVTQAPQSGGLLEAPWHDVVAAMRDGTVDGICAEYEALFVSTGKADVFLYGSHHMAGALNEKPLIALRSDLAALQLTRSAIHQGETEDHVAFMFEVMRYLIAGDDIAVCNLEQQRRFFRTHVQPWVGTSLCDAVISHPKAVTYRAVAALTQEFMAVESQAFDLIE
jgi:TorA maturation chaperone TorD